MAAMEKEVEAHQKEAFRIKHDKPSARKLFSRRQDPPPPDQQAQPSESTTKQFAEESIDRTRIVQANPSNMLQESADAVRVSIADRVSIKRSSVADASERISRKSRDLAPEYAVAGGYSLLPKRIR